MATSNDPASEFQNISRLVKTIQENANLSLSRQAIGDVQNIVLNGTPTVLEKLVDVGILEALCEHLTIDADESVLMEQLDALYLIMGRSTNQMAVWTKRIENCGGLDKLILLQYTQKLGIYQKAYNFIGKFFEGIQDRNVAMRSNF